MVSCVERIRVSRGTRIPPEHRGVSSAEVTETFTRHVRGERLSMAATMIDFSYVRAITRERARDRDSEREAYHQYVRRQTSFYVHLVLHGRESCRAPRVEGDEDDAEPNPLDIESWTFAVEMSNGRELELDEVEAGPTQLAPSGGCLVQGYVHFRGNIGRRDEWLQLEATYGDERRLRADLRWDVELFRPSGADRSKRPPSSRPRPSRPRPESDAEDGSNDSTDLGDASDDS